jgi:Uma2 family endonuclease
MSDPQTTQLQGSARRREVVAAFRRIGPRSAGLTMTPEEFDALEPEDFVDHYRYELIRGVLVVTPPAGSAEVDPNEELGYLLRSYKEHHPQGSALDVTLSERTVPTTPNRRRCDRAIWAGLGRLPDEEKDFPTIVVEFVSARRRDHRRDYEEKLREYLAAGVIEYWIIDRFRRIMTVNRQGPDGVITQVISESGSYQTELLPGFVLPLARLLALADQWSKKRRPRPPARGSD